MDYYCFNVLTDEERYELLIAFFSVLGFDSFQEKEDSLDAYLPVADWNEVLSDELDRLSERIPFTYTKTLLPDQNWNAVWESNFTPIIIDDFCIIRAEFHDPQPAIKHDILISPKMAFGTGHHATTYMMMAAMKSIPFMGTKVLDYGCGTGILAILAEQLGAENIIGVDIEAPAYQNTIENAALNHCQHITAIEGVLDNVQERDFDIVLANINRNVILDSLRPLYAKLVANGLLLASGILLKDQNLIIEQATQNGFKLSKSWTRGDWCCLLFNKV
jgi:ribosomal protein L11 methyltransferase